MLVGVAQSPAGRDVAPSRVVLEVVSWVNVDVGRRGGQWRRPASDQSRQQQLLPIVLTMSSDNLPLHSIRNSR